MSTIKKKRNYLSTKMKKELWKTFHDDIQNTNENQNKLECIYTNKPVLETCEKCHDKLIYSEEGFLTCINDKCGLIYTNILDQSAEWRYYGTEDKLNSDPTRCGMPINPYLEQSSYSCKVICPYSKSYEIQKIKRYTEWQSMPYKEKSQYDDFQFITNMAHNAGIPKIIIDDAICYHKKISESNYSFRGDNRNGIIAASIYIACQIHGQNRSAKEIAQIFYLDIKSATKGCKNAIVILNQLEQNMAQIDKTNLEETNCSSFIERYCSKLNMNQEMIKLCLFIAKKIDQLNLIPENNPSSICAGIIYFICKMCNLNISKIDVKNISDISEVTINKCCKKIETIKHQIIPSKILQKYNIQ